MAVYVWLAAALLVAVVIIQKSHEQRIPKLDFPVVGKPGDTDFSGALLEGYQKVIRPSQRHFTSWLF